MKKHPKLSLGIAVLAALGAALVIAQTNKPSGVTNGACCTTLAIPPTPAAMATTNPPANPPQTQRLPKLVDVGAGKCIPCKMMAPILEQLKTNYAGRLEVEFVDVWENPAAGKPYNIEVIPTQIFFDADGKELFRHIGFYARDDILAKWKELGVDLNSAK